MADRRHNPHLAKKKCKSEKKDWSSLLSELLRLVMFRLLVKDIIRVSSVCKAWYKSSASFRMSDRHPWFMKHSLSTRGRPCEFYDPMQSMTYLIYFPEMEGMSVYYAKDGWLLMHKDHSSELFFFNPFTRKLINLPSSESYYECAVFTCAPTSENCLVFGLANINENSTGVSTLQFGETKWKTTPWNNLGVSVASDTKIIFLEGIFYCLVRLDWVAVFDQSKPETVEYYGVEYDTSLPLSGETYFLEIKGDIYLIKTCTEKNLRFFRLNRDKVWRWEEKDKIDEELTIFGTSCISEYRSDLPNCLRSKLLLSNAPHPMIKTYYFHEGRYLANDSTIPFWDREPIYQCVWIEPPKQCLDFV